VKTDCWKVLNVRPHFGRSVMRSREARAASSGFSRLNGLFLLPSRIGSVIREQRPAAATTRTTGRSLNDAVACRGWMDWGNLQITQLIEIPVLKRGHYTPPTQVSPIGMKAILPASFKELRWSSRTRPENRLQATGEPRRVMRVGSKSYMLGSEGTGQTRAGKAAAFTKGTEFNYMSIEAKHSYRFKFLKSEEWQGNRKIVLSERKARCEICNAVDWSNDAHHMKYRKRLQFVRSDMRVLCRRCHVLCHLVVSHRKRMGEYDASQGWFNAARSVRRIIKASKQVGLELAMLRAKSIFDEIYQRRCEIVEARSTSLRTKTGGVGVRFLLPAG